MCHFSFAHGPKFDILEFSVPYTAVVRGIQSDVNRGLLQGKNFKYEAPNLKNVGLKSLTLAASGLGGELYSSLSLCDSKRTKLCGALPFHLWCEYEPVFLRGEQQYIPLKTDCDGSHITICCDVCDSCPYQNIFD